MIDDAALGARMRQAREVGNLSQHEAAAALGVVREMISYWENGRRVPSVAQLGRLAEIYAVSTSSLLGTEPWPVASEEHELVYLGLKAQPSRTKVAIRRWLAFLDDWSDLLASCDIALPGRSVPPRREWRSADPIRDSRLAPRLAQEVRKHYELGSDSIPDLLALLDREGVLVYRVALDPVGDGEGVSGVTYNHPRLGSCILVNTATTPGRQTFTLAHEFAHALFHYQAQGLVSRADAPDGIERFADAFAAHFLVPGGALRKRVSQLPYQKVASAFDVIDLHRSFRVSYATMLNRLRGEHLLAPGQYEEFRGYSPSHLASRLGLTSDEYFPTSHELTYSLGCYPTSVLDRVSRLITDEHLSPTAAADLLQVSLEEILGELLAKPEPASAAESREFVELPAPTMTRRNRRTLTA